MPSPSENGVLGAILNFLLPGLGYWYLGYRKVFGIHPVLFLIVIWIVEGVTVFWISPLYALAFFISLFLAYDAYLKAIGKPGWVRAEKN